MSLPARSRAHPGRVPLVPTAGAARISPFSRTPAAPTPPPRCSTACAITTGTPRSSPTAPTPPRAAAGEAMDEAHRRMAHGAQRRRRLDPFRPVDLGQHLHPRPRLRELAAAGRRHRRHQPGPRGQFRRLAQADLARRRGARVEGRPADRPPRSRRARQAARQQGPARRLAARLQHRRRDQSRRRGRQARPRPSAPSPSSMASPTPRTACPTCSRSAATSICSRPTRCTARTRASWPSAPRSRPSCPTRAISSTRPVRASASIPAGPDHAQIAAAAGIVDYLEKVAEIAGTAVQGAGPFRIAHNAMRAQETALLAPLLDYLRKKNGIRLIGPDDPAKRAPTVSIVARSPGRACRRHDLAPQYRRRRRPLLRLPPARGARHQSRRTASCACRSSTTPRPKRSTASSRRSTPNSSRPRS